MTSAVTRLATNGAGAPLPAPPAPAADEPEPEPAAPADPFAVKPDGELSLTVAHSFSRADARERVSQLLAYWAERFGVQSEWHGFRVFLSGKVLGIAVRAIFEVRDANVEAMAENPGSLLAGTARRYVDAKLHKYLHPTYAEP